MALILCFKVDGSNIVGSICWLNLLGSICCGFNLVGKFFRLNLWGSLCGGLNLWWVEFVVGLICSGFNL